MKKKNVNQFYNSFQIYAYFRKSKTFFCQYAGLFDIYESFVVDKKEVRTSAQWGEIFSEQVFNFYFTSDLRRSNATKEQKLTTKILLKC